MKKHTVRPARRVGLVDYASGAAGKVEKKQTALESISSRISLLGTRYRMLADSVQDSADRLTGSNESEDHAAELGVSGGIIGDINAGLDQLQAVADRIVGEIDRLNAAI